MEPNIFIFEKNKFTFLIFEIENNQNIEEIITSTYYLKTEGVLSEIPLDNYFLKFNNDKNIFRLIIKIVNNKFELVSKHFSEIKTFEKLEEISNNFEFNKHKKYFLFQKND
jgi:hypothetical protein